MKLIEQIYRKPALVAFGLRRGGSGQSSSGGGTVLSITRNAESVSLITGAGAMPLQAATPSVAGVLGAADKTKLDSVEDSATADQTGSEMVAAIDTHLGTASWRQGGGGGASNLSVARDADSVTVSNDGGTDAVLPGASAAAAGVMTGADKAKLDGLGNALATPTSDGLMSGTDKAKLDGLGAGQPGAGDMSAATYDPQGIVGDAFDRANHGGQQAISTISGLEDALDDKAPTSHTHAITDVAGLQSTLDGKAPAGHTQAIASITGLQAELDGKAPTGHTHAITDVAGLESTLDGKAPTSHAHAIANVTGLQAEIDGKAAASHAHDASQVTSGTIAHARGGLQADVSAYDGLVKISGGTTSQAVAGQDYATAAQGALADSAVQPGDDATALDGTAHHLLYVDDSGSVAELGYGANGTFLKSQGPSAPPAWETPAGGGSGDMPATTYDPAGIVEQLVGLTATQTLTNKTLTQPALVLSQSAAPTPTAEGDIRWDTDDNRLIVGNGSGQAVFLPNDAFSGDASVAASGVVEIANNAVGNAKLADMAQATIKGRASGGGTGDPQDLSAAQLRTILGPSGTPGATTYLRGDGTWATVAGGSGNVTKVGTPVAKRMAYWTGDGTLGHEDGFAYDPATDTLSVSKIVIGGITFDGENQLTDPDANSLLGWDDGNGTATWYRVSAGLEFIGSELRLTANQRTTAIEFVIDGGGSAITAGPKGVVQVPMGCTITAARLLADQPGSIVVDIWKDTFANYPPTDADSITASTPPRISAAAKSENVALTGWTTGVAAGDILAFNVDSASGVERVTVALIATVS